MIKITSTPQRIISLVPSQTEFLADLGLEQEVVGITKFCVHPLEWFQTKARVGGTKTLHFGKIADLKPDLIIGNKEENEREQIEALSAQFSVWMSDIVTLQDALDMMAQLGALTGRVEKAQSIITNIKERFQEWLSARASSPRRRAAYFIWRKPYMVAAGGTFIHEMLQIAGFDNVFADQSRYPEVTLSTLAAAQPECIFLSSEPYPFAKKDFAAFQEVCPKATIYLVDGEIFSWYGSRLLQAPAYFRTLQERMELDCK